MSVVREQRTSTSANNAPRWYSLGVLPHPPGPPDYPAHHPDCPCCRLRQRVEWACRSAYGMRGAGFGDQTIDRQLRRAGFGPYERELAIEFLASEVGPAANTFRACLPNDRLVATSATTG